MLLPLSDIISTFLYYFFFFFSELKLCSKAKSPNLYAVTRVWIALTSCLEFNLYSWVCSLMLRSSWIASSESFFCTLIAQWDKGLQYFIYCYCCLFLLCLAQKPWLYRGICILLYGHIWKLISGSKNLCCKVKMKQLKRKYKQRDMSKVKKGSVDLTVFS